MSGIKIVATVVVKPEYREALLAQFADLVTASRREAGNLRYDLHQARAALKSSCLSSIGLRKPPLMPIMPAHIFKTL